MKTAFYPGSFDPPTLGHLDVIARGLRLADRLVIGIGVHPGKSPWFTAAEREEMLRGAIGEAVPGGSERTTITTFDGLVTAAATDAGATLLVRGLRDATDFDYEMQMAGMNGAMAPQIDTVFLPASPSVRPITATLVRQIAKMGGPTQHFVPGNVAKRLATKTN